MNRPETEARTGMDETTGNEDSAVQLNGQAVEDSLGVFEGNPITDDIDMAELAKEGSAEPLKPQTLGLNVSVSKPSKTARFRTHPDPRYWPTAYSVELDIPGEFEKISLIVAPNLVHLFQGEAKRRRFALYCTADQHLRFWPYAVDEVGEPDGDHASTVFNVCLHARDQWVSTKWHKGEGYRAYAAQVGGDPQWPDKSPLELLKLAHKGRLVASEEHDRVREFRARKPL
jgi:hypothetical protein